MPKLKILRLEELRDIVCIIVGTRPGIIKFSPIIKELIRRQREFFILHTGQHYSYNMDRLFFEELELPEPKYYIPGTHKEKYHGAQTAKMLKGCEKAMLKEKPKLTLVGGDANTNLAGALAARKLHIYVGHVEAGLRSYDWRMPEEHNRVIIDHISDFLFAPTKKAKENLIKDGVRGKIFVTGNPIVDAVRQNIKVALRKSKILEKLNLRKEDYFLMTLHREENVDVKENLVNILKGIRLISSTYGLRIVFPMHPRTRDRIRRFNLIGYLKDIKELELIKPIGYLDFLLLLKNCKLVLTDSGGVQEESCILKVPCVTLRDRTERPETVDVGANHVAGVNPVSILKGIDIMLNRKREWKNPFGERVSEKIVDIIERELDL